MKPIAEAYASGANAWAEGPTRVYHRLAEALVEFSPVALGHRSVLDLGSGTGTGSRAARAAGARVVAADLAPEMLQIDRADRPPAVAADANALPFTDAAFDVVLAPFCLNHLDDPAVGVREALRVAPVLLASTYAADDDHPSKAAVDRALTELGWTPPQWYADVKVAMSTWGTVDGAAGVVERGGGDVLAVERVAVPFPELTPEDLVAWRMGLAQCARFVDQLPPSRRARAVERALELLGAGPPVLVRQVIFVAAGVRNGPALRSGG